MAGGPLEVGGLKAGRAGSRAAVKLRRVGEHEFTKCRTARTVVDEPTASIAAVVAAAYVCPVHIERAKAKATYDGQLRDNVHVFCILVVL